MTLLYALGYGQRLVDDGWLPKGETLDDLRTLFEKMPDQPASKDLPDKPQLLGDSQARFKSRVLGCEVEVETPSELPSIQLAEAVISALEAFLATSLKTGVFPHRDKIAISIHSIPETLDVPRYEADEGGSSGIKIFHSTPVYIGTVEGQRKFSEWMQELVLRVVAHIAVISDPEAYFERIAGVERAFGRAINNAYVGVFFGNILGDKPMLCLSDWSRGFSGERFPLRRSSPRRETKPEEVSLEPYTPTSSARGEPPEGLFDAERGTHSDIKVVSLIDLPLWNKAGWVATVYAAFPSAPPVLALGFRDREQQTYRHIEPRCFVAI